MDGLKLKVKALDAIDGTPVLDIKPHVREFEPDPVARPAAAMDDRVDARLLLLTVCFRAARANSADVNELHLLRTAALQTRDARHGIALAATSSTRERRMRETARSTTRASSVPKSGVRCSCKPTLRFVGRKPGGISTSSCGGTSRRTSQRWALTAGSFSADRLPHSATLAPAANVAGEGGFLHPAMNPGLFEGLEGRCLGMCEPGLDTAFGKNPASLAGLTSRNSISPPRTR